eukprot:3935620-Rhodomonas_salina.1
MFIGKIIPVPNRTYAIVAQRRAVLESPGSSHNRMKSQAQRYLWQRTGTEVLYENGGCCSVCGATVPN